MVVSLGFTLELGHVVEELDLDVRQGEERYEVRQLNARRSMKKDLSSRMAFFPASLNTGLGFSAWLLTVVLICLFFCELARRLSLSSCRESHRAVSCRQQTSSSLTCNGTVSYVV